MIPTRIALAAAMALPLYSQGQEQPGPVRTLGTVTVTGGQPTSLPTQIPTTIEGITREEIEHPINATDSEDALKYLPSLLVRKRYIGDYNHAMLVHPRLGHRQQRALGGVCRRHPAVQLPGQRRAPIRAALGHGDARGDRAGRRDVRAVLGRLSRQLGRRGGRLRDAHAARNSRRTRKLGYVPQPFDLYNTHDTFNSWQTSASLGSNSGDWSWWIDVNRTDSQGQPLTFATRLASAGVPGGGRRAGDRRRAGPEPHQPGLVHPGHRHAVPHGAGPRQGQAGLRLLARPCAPATRWAGGRTRSKGGPTSYLRNAAGQPVYSGAVNIEGRALHLAPTDFPLTSDSQTHFMHGLSVKSHTRGDWDWEVAASLYDYAATRSARPRWPCRGAPRAAPARFRTRTAPAGTRWRPRAPGAPGRGRRAHRRLRLQRDAYRLRSLENATGDWLAARRRRQPVGGDTSCTAPVAQDTWSFAPQWKTVLGLRCEHWNAPATASNASTTSLHTPGAANPTSRPRPRWPTS